MSKHLISAANSLRMAAMQARDTKQPVISALCDSVAEMALSIATLAATEEQIDERRAELRQLSAEHRMLKVLK